MPNPNYLGHVLNLLDERCSAYHANKVCEEIPRRFDDFPNLRELEALIAELYPTAGVTKKYKEPEWVSMRCRGIQPVLEAIFNNFESNNGNAPHVKRMMEYSGYTEDELFLIYEDWYVGKLHPLCAEYDQRIRAPINEFLVRSPRETRSI